MAMASSVVSDFKPCEEFICSLYGLKNHKDVNSARCHKLLQIAKCKDQDLSKDKLKKVNCDMLPPCRDTLKNKILRANMVSLIWGRADQKNPGQDLDDSASMLDIDD